MTASCIYQGTVVHQRLEPVTHRLQYRVAMLFLDLDELPDLCRTSRLWSVSRPAVLRFRRDDHLGDPQVPLIDAVRELVQSVTGLATHGPVRLLTTPRWFGAGFNPISVYYVHERADEPPVAAVFEVSNTPWREMHPYVLDLRTARHASGIAAGRFAKTLHVSPFLPMDIDYVWTLTDPEERLGIAIECQRDERRVMIATASLRRSKLDDAALRRFALRVPPMHVVTVGGIYWNAVRLRAKGAQYHAHPASGPALSGARPV